MGRAIGRGYYYTHAQQNTRAQDTYEYVGGDKMPGAHWYALVRTVSFGSLLLTAAKVESVPPLGAAIPV